MDGAAAARSAATGLSTVYTQKQKIDLNLNERGRHRAEHTRGVCYIKERKKQKKIGGKKDWNTKK